MARLLDERSRDRAIALAGAALLFLLYNLNGRVLMTHDADANVYLAVNVVENGSMGFSPSRTPQLFRSPYSRAALVPSVRVDPVTAEPLFVGLYGPGAGLSAVPLFAAVRPFVGNLLERESAVFHLGKAAAAIFAAAAAALVYLTARRWASPRPAVVLALAFGVGTGTWSSSSQALWQHAPTTFFVMLGSYFFVRDARLRYAAAGAAYAAAVACRPLAVVFAAAVGVHLLVADRRAAAAFALGALPFAAALGLYNAYWLGSPLRSGQLALAGAGLDYWDTPLLEGLAGILGSPARGLFVFSPFLLLAVPGAILAWRRPEYVHLRPLSIAVLAALVVHAKWRYWWGGHSYGYRIIVDLAGPMTLLLLPVVGLVAASFVRRLVFAALVAWSALVHGLGAVVVGGSWSATPDIDVPANHHRLWSVRDGPIPWELASLYRGIRSRLAPARARR